MLYIPKKNGILRTVFDLQQKNENTWKDVTPFPDQAMICHDIAWAKFRSKLNMTEADEQMCIRTEDVCKMTFSTIFSTFSEPSNTNGGLQCTLHIPAVDDCYILRVTWKNCTCISRQYIHIFSEHPRAYRAHNESAPTTQRVAILSIEVKTWLILRQDQLSGTCHWWQWHTCQVG